MIGFWEWFTMNHNWVSSLIPLAMFSYIGWLLSGGLTWKGKVASYVFSAVIFGVMFWAVTYLSGYGMYKRHYTTCAKPEAVASFYVFDAKKERCYKPVVGFAPVDDNQVKTLTPKQMETGEWL